MNEGEKMVRANECEMKIETDMRNLLLFFRLYGEGCDLTSPRLVFSSIIRPSGATDLTLGTGLKKKENGQRHQIEAARQRKRWAVSKPCLDESFQSRVESIVTCFFENLEAKFSVARREEGSQNVTRTTHTKNAASEWQASWQWQ